MNNQEIQNELLQVQKEITELPAGYISKKNINGKTRYYLQWTENGKKKSKYVDDAIVDDLRAKIERRRELQKREKELTFMLPKPHKTEKQEEEKHVFKTDVMLGENLKSYVQTVANYKKRSLYKNICDYVYGDVRDRVFILYGLRRTGKTTLIRQVIAEMNEEDFSKTAFIQVSAGIGLQKRRRLFEISSLKSRSVWFENGTEKARKQRNENSKRLIKSAILGNADIFVVRKSYKT